MSPYDPSAKCRKCGHDVITTKFCKEPLTGIDCLKRGCLRCGYGWSEAPLDAQMPKLLTRKRWLSTLKANRARRV